MGQEVFQQAQKARRGCLTAQDDDGVAVVGVGVWGVKAGGGPDHVWVDSVQHGLCAPFRRKL